MKSKLFLSALALAVMFSFIPVSARASGRDQLTKVTFSEAVEVPGAILPAGTYWFVLADSDSDRNRVQIFSADEKTLYATLNTVPMERNEVTTDSAFTLAARPSDKPEALLTWFYPGYTSGHEFLYSRHEQKELAMDHHDTIVSSGFAGGH